MKKFILIISGLLLTSTMLRSQLISTFDHSVNAAALSHSSVAFVNNNSLFTNIGAVSLQDQSTASLNGGLLFGLSELKIFQAGLAMKITENDFGVATLGSFGDLNYRETSVGLGYSRQIGRKIGLGFRGNYAQLRIPEFGTNGYFTFNGGMLWEVIQNFWLGYQTQFFPEPESITSGDPFYHHLGIGYQIANHTTVMISTVYRGAWSIQGGLVYSFRDSMAFKIGVDGSDPSFSLGVEYKISPGFLLAGAFQYHSALGISPFFGLVYLLPRKSQGR